MKSCVNKTNHKWFNKNCKNELRKLRGSLRKFNGNRACQKSQSKYFVSRKTYHCTIRNSKRAYFRNLYEKIESGKILDWKNFNTLKTTREPTKTLEIDDLKAFTNYFEKLYNKGDTRSTTTYNQTNDKSFDRAKHTRDKIFDSQIASDCNDILNSSITCEEIVQAVKSIKSDKSSSEDQISNEMIKHLNIPGHENRVKPLSNKWNISMEHKHNYTYS